MMQITGLTPEDLPEDTLRDPATWHPGIADQEAVSVLLERGRMRMHLLTGTDAQVRAAARALVLKPLDVPPPNTMTTRKDARAAPLAFGPIVEAFFREGRIEIDAVLDAHAKSSDVLVRELVTLLRKGGAPLEHRRDVALRVFRAPMKERGEEARSLEITKRIIGRLDELPPNAEAFAAIHEREETLHALQDLGQPAIAPVLVARALTGDAPAVDMLAALGDRSLSALAFELERRRTLEPAERSRTRLYEAAIVRMFRTLNARDAAPSLRELLAQSPMTNWREGLERGVLVRELIITLGDLDDRASAPLLLEILESTSQEYRSVLPMAAFALGRLCYGPALPALESFLFSPKDPVACEAVWAVGTIGAAHPHVLREKATDLLERLRGLEPGAEVTRLAALAKSAAAPGLVESQVLRSAIDRALWEPAFRQEETSRRRAWGLRALEELAPLGFDRGALFLGHEAVRHLVTRDDHRVRNAAESAFRAWGIPIPEVRKYYSFRLPELEKRGGIHALLEAIRDPLGVFRHNVATRLAELGDARAIRPLAEATARLFQEPATSTYEYDDAPPHLVAFVRALARLNKPETNEILIEGLRGGNHQVRAVIAENAPEDERFVPELMAMLGDPRSFLRSRAEKSLTSLGAIPAPVLPGTTEIASVARTVEG